jgi:hypothetical protein
MCRTATILHYTRILPHQKVRIFPSSYSTTLLDPNCSDCGFTSASQVRAPAIIVLVVGNQNARRWNVLRCYVMHTPTKAKNGPHA